jgi:HlyD family secretion protein
MNAMSMPPSKTVLLLCALAACGDSPPSTQNDPNVYVVGREDLPITVKENGELQAVRETIVRSQVEGQATIIYLIPEGTSVQTGDKLVELDVSELVEKRASQEIAVEKARSALEQARTQRDILEKELTTKINTATSMLRIANMELEKLLGAHDGSGSEGRNRDMVKRLRELVSAPPPAPLDDEEPAAPTTTIKHVDPRNYAGLVDKAIALLRVEAEGDDDPLDRDMGEMANKILQQADQIRLAMADLKVKEDTAAHSRRLAAKQFITRNELERDELAFQSQASKVTIAWNDLELLINYSLLQDRIRLTQDAENSRLEVERVHASNDAERKKSQFDIDAKEKEFNVALERLNNLNRQVQNSISYAPTPGLVVYARMNRDRRGGEAIAEGTQVRERQELIVLPDNSKMNCIVKVQEAQVDKVQPGQLAHIGVEAYPTEILTGRVTRVAPVADSSNSWMGNDKKVYTTIVELDGINTDSRMRSRMAAAATITVETLRDVLTVPMQAVRRDRSVNYVWKGTPQGPVAVRVKVGAHNQEKVEILDGVSAGDRVYRTPPGGQPDPKFDQPALPEGAPLAPEPSRPVGIGGAGPAADAAARVNGGAPGNGPGGPADGGGNRPGRGGGGSRALFTKPLAEMAPPELEAAKAAVASMEQMLDGMREMMSPEQLTTFEGSVTSLKDAFEKNDLAAAQAAIDALRAAMPRRAGGGRPGGGGPGGGRPGGGAEGSRGGQGSE